MTKEKALATSRPGQPCPGPGGHPAQPATVPGTPGRAHPSEPHERGPGTGHAGTQLLPATNKACLMPGTAGRLWALAGSVTSPGEHGTTLPPTTALSPAPHGAWVAQDQVRPSAPAPGEDARGLGRLPSAPVPSSPVLVVDVVSKARGVDDCQLHANPLLFNL